MSMMNLIDKREVIWEYRISELEKNDSFKVLQN